MFRATRPPSASRGQDQDIPLQGCLLGALDAPHPWVCECLNVYEVWIGMANQKLHQQQGIDKVSPSS